MSQHGLADKITFKGYRMTNIKLTRQHLVGIDKVASVHIIVFKTISIPFIFGTGYNHA